MDLAGLPFSLEDIARLPVSEQREILKMLETYNEKKALAEARGTFMGFVHRMWPEFIEGRHHREIAKVFDGIRRGELKRVCIHLPPRHTKSEFTSWLLPANLLGHKPKGKIIQVSNTAELASGFGRKVRDTMETPEYNEIFPNVTIKADSRSAGRWNTNKGGEYYATGIGGALAGRGADALIIDDPHTEAEAQSALYNPKIFDDAYDWYVLARQRLQPGGAILIVMTRWGKRDMAGRVIGKAMEDGSISDWKIIDYPAILPSGNPLWPEFWPLEELQKVKQDIPPSRWLAQYQQRPTNDSGAIIKRENWKPWKGPRLPEFVYVINSYDTAYTANTSNDFSARTTWGVFWYPDKNGRDIPNVMLIDSWRDRLEYPALKTHVMQDMRDWSPDTTLIEARGSGRTLVDDLRSMGLFIEEFTPARGAAGISNDKVARANAVADVFSSGIVWYNTECPLNDTTIEECADLPRGDNDDLADTATQAIKALRDRMLIGTQHDENPIYREDHDDDQARRYTGRIY